MQEPSGAHGERGELCSTYTGQCAAHRASSRAVRSFFAASLIFLESTSPGVSGTSVTNSDWASAKREHASKCF